MNKGLTVAAQQVIDGRRIRLTLEQMQQESQQMVRLDWLRFTLPIDAIVRSDREASPDLAAFAAADAQARRKMVACRLVDASLDYTGAMALARETAKQLVEHLGLFEVGQVEDQGMDFYTARCPLILEGATVGWCLAGGKSLQQAGTVHVNLFGGACLHLSPAKLALLRDWLQRSNGWLTRTDLAVDVWSGEDIQLVESLYLEGAFDVRGQRPSQTNNGSWTCGHSRTFNVGKRETGKMLRAYEKGDQLFGHEANDPWVRYEVELRNNARVLDLDLLIRPADFFAGAYPFCAALLDRLQVEASAQRIPAGQKLADVTAEAAAMKAAQWTSRVAGPTVCALLSMGGDILDFIVQAQSHRTPTRFRGFTPAAMRQALQKVAERFAPHSAPSMVGA